MLVKKTNTTLLLALSLVMSASAHASKGLVELSDAELAATQGQALFNMSYLAPTDAGNNQANTGFYRLGLEAELQLNINVKKLQLGCGGVNGSGGCDIDIDNLSLSGNSSTRDGRVTSDAILTNPFIEFAIKNPGSASTREVSGFRLSAAQAQGLLTAGTENTATPNGINSLSGYLKVQSDSSGLIKGQVATAPGYFDASDPNNRIQGKLNAPFGTVATFHLDQGGFWIPGFTNLNFSVPGKTLNGNRITGLSVNPVVKLPDIVLGRDFNNSNCTPGNCNQYGASPPGFSPVATTYAGNTFTDSDGNGNVLSFSGGTVPGKSQGGVNPANQSNPYSQAINNSLRAHVDNCSGIGCIVAGDSYYVNMYTRVRNVTANVNVNQPLGLIHSLQINSPVSLSLQKEALNWPGQTYFGANDSRNDTAKPGWWLSVSDPINLGTITPVNPVDLCEGGTGNPAKCAFPQVADQVNTFLAANPPSTSDLGALIFQNDALGIMVGNTGSTGGIGLTPLSLNVDGLVLSNQYFAPNCYGGLTFC